MQISQYWRYWNVNFHTMSQIIFTEMRAQFTGKPELQPQHSLKERKWCTEIPRVPIDQQAFDRTKKHTPIPLVIVSFRRVYATAWLLGCGFESRRRHGWSTLQFVMCCVGSDLCDTLINRSLESYRVYVPNCVRLETSKRGGLVWCGQQRPKNREGYASITKHGGAFVQPLLRWKSNKYCIFQVYIRVHVMRYAKRPSRCTTFFHIIS
jgi:hypothetical protein